jgi:hypothetical protein
MRSRTTVGAGISLGAIMAVPATAQADDFTVTNLNDSGPGSLREATDLANENAGADRVLFQSKLSGTINLNNSSGDFPAVYISDGDLEIVGPGARQITVDAPSGFPAFAPFANFDSAPPIDVEISGLRIAGGDNTSGYFGTSGGGVQSVGEVDLTLSRVTIAGNSAAADGGGVAAFLFAGGSGELLIEHSTVSGNSAGNRGGGVYSAGDELAVRNSTISGNTAGGNGGGALFFTTPTFANSTVTDNQAGGDGGGLIEYSGATLRGMIVADNVASTDPNLDDGSWETSFSLIGEAPNSNFDDQGGNFFDADPNLLALADNGGPTDTHAFKSSPAKNAGPSDAPSSDQRGAPRKGQPDIGAYEVTKCGGVIVNRVGTAGKDKLNGTSGKDGILGLGGKDKLSGKGKKDGLCGAAGKDKLKGGGGKDKLKGGPGKDKLVGGPGKDKLNGGPGKDKEIQ